MSMEDFNCEFLELEIHISSEQFDKIAFFKDVDVVFDEKKGTRMLAFGSLEKPGKQHAHILADFRREKQSRFTITYHNFGVEGKDPRPPYMEDCVQWLGQFFKEDLISTELTAAFQFDEKYAPIISMPFPLLAANKRLLGSEITGVSIKLPGSMKIKRAIIQSLNGKTGIQIEKEFKMKVKEFDLKQQLEQLSIPVMMLVNPIGDSK